MGDSGNKSAKTGCERVACVVLVESLEKVEVMEAQPVRSEPKNGQAAGRGWRTERLCATRLCRKLPERLYQSNLGCDLR